MKQDEFDSLIERIDQELSKHLYCKDTDVAEFNTTDVLSLKEEAEMYRVDLETVLASCLNIADHLKDIDL